jgi:hypothetical protein
MTRQLLDQIIPAIIDIAPEDNFTPSLAIQMVEEARNIIQEMANPDLVYNTVIAHACIEVKERCVLKTYGYINNLGGDKLYTYAVKPTKTLDKVLGNEPFRIGGKAVAAIPFYYEDPVNTSGAAKTVAYARQHGALIYQMDEPIKGISFRVYLPVQSMEYNSALDCMNVARLPH